jgi:hypothetical protein
MRAATGALDHAGRLLLAVARKLDRIPGAVHEAACVRPPVRDRELGIVQRPPQRPAQLGLGGRLAELDDEPPHGRTRQPHPQQAEEERERERGEQTERKPCRHVGGPRCEGLREVDQRQGDDPGPAGREHGRERPAQRARCRTPPVSELDHRRPP